MSACSAYRCSGPGKLLTLGKGLPRNTEPTSLPWFSPAPFLRSTMQQRAQLGSDSSSSKLYVRSVGLPLEVSTKLFCSKVPAVQLDANQILGSGRYE